MFDKLCLCFNFVGFAYAASTNNGWACIAFGLGIICGLYLINEKE